MLVVVTCEDMAGRGRPEHERVLSELAREGRQLALGALDVDAVKALYESSSGEPPTDAIANAIHAASEGNPFLIDETIVMLRTKGDIHRPDYSVGFRVPEGARGLMRARLEGVGDEVTELLSIASVIGREFDLTLLQRVVDIEIDTLLEILGQAVAAQLISETSSLGRYSFTHILIRETLYEGIISLRRRSWHRLFAEEATAWRKAVTRLS